MYHLSRFEKETVLVTNETEDFYRVSTFNNALKKRFSEYSAKYPELCQRVECVGLGCEAYQIKKSSLSFRLIAPLTPEQRAAAKLRAKKMRAGREKKTA